MTTNTAVTPPAPTQPRVPVPVTEALTHVGAHTDEHVAIYFWQVYGERFFPGAAKTVVRFVMDLEARGDAAFDADGKVPFGCGKGRYDEHKGKGRVKGTCSALMVAQDIGLTHDKVIMRIINEALRCDTTGGVKTTELPNIIKAFNRSLKNADAYIWQWSKRALKCVHHYLYYQYGPSAGEKTLLEIFDDLAKRNHFHAENDMQKEALVRLRKSIEESMERCEKLRQERQLHPDSKPDYIFELCFIVEAMHRCSQVITPEDVVEWVRFALDRLYSDQLGFLACVEFCKKMRAENKCWYDIHALAKGRKRTLQLFFSKSDNPQMQAAARHLGASVIILYNSQNQVVVLINSYVRGLHLVDFTRMVRWLELEDKRGARWFDLGMDGEYPGVNNWYFHRVGQQLMNGSLTNPGKRPTQIHPNTFIEIARHAFDRHLTDKWREDRGLETSRTYRIRMRRNRRINARIRHAAQAAAKRRAEKTAVKAEGPKEAQASTSPAPTAKPAKELSTVVTLDELESKLALKAS